jgi:hypothetical protein
MWLKSRLLSFLCAWNLFHEVLSVSTEDILKQIRKTHEQIGKCRLRCLSEFSPSYQDSVCFRIPKCQTCWDLCQRFTQNKRDRQVYCTNPDPLVCDDGCRLSCKQFNDDPEKPSSQPVDIIFSTNFVGCTLFWKTNNENMTFINQLYGMDDQVKKTRILGIFKTINPKLWFFFEQGDMV